MGAEFNFYIFPPESKKEDLGKLADAVFEKARYDYGHIGYSGTFAECGSIIFEPNVFHDDDQAIDWLEEHAEKWEPALVVTIKAPFDSTPRYIMGAWCSS